MENTNELSIKVQATCNEAIKSLDRLVTAMTGVENAFKDLTKVASKNTVATEVKQVGTELDKVSTKSDKAFSTLKKLFTFAGAKKIGQIAVDWTEKSMDYSEALNLFNVILDDSTTKATKFQNVMNEAFGTNMTDTLTRQGLFQSMAENMGIASDYAYIMSENTTKLVNDISSLYNKKESTVSEALRAGIYAGQTKPLRSFGMDITEKTLQPELERLGIDRTVRDLNQAEKQLLRYISVLRQSQDAHGDWANTIEAPANQLKIFSNQLTEAQRALSNLFIGTFAKILPYANAILMVVEEVANAIATMFGIEISDYNSSIASAEDAYVELGESIDDDIDKAKKLTKQMLSFDQTHNINENNNSSNGDISGGIDQRLLDAITGYDNGMEKVRMKAVEIRDKIMEWLGFTKETDFLTGDVSFKYTGINKLLKNVVNGFGKLSTQGKILVGIGLSALIINLFNGTKKLVTVLGGQGLVKIVKSLLTPVKTLYNSLDKVNSSNKNLTTGLSEGISKWSSSLTMLDRFKVALVGILGLTTSLSGMKSAMESVADEGWNLGNSLMTVASGLGAVASGAYIGSMFGPIGTVIGGVTGGVWALYEALTSIPTAYTKATEEINKNLDAIEEYNSEVKEQYDAIKQNEIANVSLQTSYSNLLSELKTITDENGKVKDGYVDRAEFIITTLNKAYGLEISMIDGVIQKYGEQIKAIEDVILEKKKEIALESSEEAYKFALKEKVNSYLNLTNAQKEYNNAIKLQQKYEDKLKKTWDKYKDSYYSQYETFEKFVEVQEKSNKEYRGIIESVERAKINLDDATASYDSNINAILTYEGLLSADTKENAELVEKYINDIENSYYNGKEYISLTYEQQKEDALLYYAFVLKETKEKGKEINDEIIAQAESRLNTLKANISDMTNEVDGEMGDNLILAWKTLAETSEEQFLTEFAKLDDDIQTEVVSKMYDKGYSISEELQKGIEKINPTFKVKTDLSDANKTIVIDADTTGAQQKTQSFWDKLRAAFNTTALSTVFKLPFFKFADGGFPETGQMFLAREAGPELVGQIGHKTAVANNEQIVQAVSAGVYNAVASAMSQISNSTVVDLNIHTEEGIIVEKAVRGIEQHVAQTGELPFTVPI